MRELLIDVDYIGEIPYSKEELFDENNNITFRTRLGDSDFGGKLEFTINGLQLKYICEKEGYDLTNMLEVDQLCAEMAWPQMLMFESTEDIKSYLKALEIKESVLKKIHELIKLLGENEEVSVKLRDNYKILLGQILLTILNYEELLEDVLQYMIKDFNFDNGQMEEIC